MENDQTIVRRLPRVRAKYSPKLGHSLEHHQRCTLMPTWGAEKKKVARKEQDHKMFSR